MGDFAVLVSAPPRKGRVAIDGARVRGVREKKFAWTRAELGQRVGLSQSAIQGIEVGDTRTVYHSTFRKLAEAFGMSLDEARERLSSGGNGFDQNVEPYSEQKIDVEIPLFELDVAAGAWADISDVGEVCDPRAIDQGLFRVRIRGDSMKPKYVDGNVVEFRCLRPDRDGIIIGRDYYVQRADGMATFKCVESVEDETITLRALNRRRYKQPIIVERALIVRMALAVAKVEILA